MSKRRGLQKRTAEALKPLGFTALSGTTFTRQVDQQLHFVGLQYRRSSSEISFNLGCHFAGIPSIFDFQPVSVNDLEDLDCGLRIRVGRYIGDGFYDIWWDPANSEVPAALAQASWAIARAFNDCQKQWGNGALLLKSHVKNRGGAIRLSRPLIRWMNAQRKFARFGFVALLAHHHAQQTLASSLCEKALSCDDVIPSQVPQLLTALDGSRFSKERGHSGMASEKGDFG